MINKILKWAKKTPTNTGILGMVLMLTMLLIFDLPVMIPLIKQYGWFAPLPIKKILYFVSVILISFWLTFEIVIKYVVKNDNL